MALSPPIPLSTIPQHHPPFGREPVFANLNGSVVAGYSADTRVNATSRRTDSSAVFVPPPFHFAWAASRTVQSRRARLGACPTPTRMDRPPPFRCERESIPRKCTRATRENAVSRNRRNSAGAVWVYSRNSFAASSNTSFVISGKNPSPFRPLAFPASIPSPKQNMASSISLSFGVSCLDIRRSISVLHRTTDTSKKEGRRRISPPPQSVEPLPSE